MIKDEVLTIKISNKTFAYYSEIYNNIKIGDFIDINSLLLQRGSNVSITGICDYCGKERKISNKSYNLQTNNNKEKFTCSKKCSLLKTKETNLEKWGVDNPFQSKYIKDKIKISNLEKYGVDNPQKSEHIRGKTRLTSLKKYGFSKPSMSDVVKEKVKITNNYKFGVDYPAQSESIRNKMMNSCYNKYGVYNFSKTKDFKDIINKNSFNKMSKKLEEHGILLDSNNGEYTIRCEVCNSNFSILYSLMYKRIVNGDIICINCNTKKQPIKENELYDFISLNYSGHIFRNYRKIISKEIDIYLPHLKLAFEFNGLWWHSELYKERNYHSNKTKECLEKGIQLIHIWEDDWDQRIEIVKSIILNKLGKSKRIFARNCEVKEVNDNNIIRDFLETNHIQGFVGSSIKLGLFYNNELVSIMIFGSLRKSLGQRPSDGSYELLRFCSKLGMSVVGGASKLLKYFTNNYNYNEIISYSDNSRSDGNIYRKLGFKLENETVINYYWVVNGIRIHRFNFRKDKLIKDGYDPNKTEIEIMNERGFNRVFDSGSKKWIFKKLV
jgi:very-short-patch-repair endonuclease